MNIIYNGFDNISSNLTKFFNKYNNILHKPQINFLPSLFIGILKSKSLCPSNISDCLSKYYSEILPTSINKRITRMLNNKRFKGHELYNAIVKNIINNYSVKHHDNKVHIIIDHMYSKDNYTLYVASIRIGKQGIPLYFKSFYGINVSEAYLDETIKDAITYIHNLFYGSNLELVFLADRWFNSSSLLNYIDSLGHTYCIRLKGIVRIKYFDNKENNYIYSYTEKLQSNQNYATYYDDVILNPFSENVKCKIAISKRDNLQEPWIIATNGEVKRAIRNYSYRFGGIETIFKNQKSNCFYLEKTVNASINYFDNLYSVLCIINIFLVCLGTDYSKNSKCYKDKIIETHKNINGIKTRVISLFKVGLKLFTIAFENTKYIRLPIRFILYDI